MTVHMVGGTSSTPLNRVERATRLPICLIHFNAGFFNDWLVHREVSLATMAAGVFAGAMMPTHEFNSIPGMPDSLKVGISG